MTSRPLAIDLYTGLHGWAEGLIDAGFYVIGVDIVDMSKTVGVEKPEHFHLLIQNVLTLHGRQFKDARLIVGSSPCQNFSYRAMPFTRGRSLTGPFLGIKLFWEQFRIQREACEAAGRHIPMVVENVRGAIPWVGRSKYHFGSYHLWGDVPALMPEPVKSTKNGELGGGSWFAIGSPGQTVTGVNPDGRKVPGFRFDGSGRSFQTASVEAHGLKAPGGDRVRNRAPHTPHLTNTSESGLKHGGDWFSDPSSPSRQGGQTKLKPPSRVSKESPVEGRKGAGAGAVWFDQNTSSLPSASPRRKAASAKIAKIPYTLARWIGEVYLPPECKP